MQPRPTLRAPHTAPAIARPGLVPGCPGAAPLHDHALLPWRFHPVLCAADGILSRG